MTFYDMFLCRLPREHALLCTQPTPPARYQSLWDHHRHPLQEHDHAHYKPGTFAGDA